MAGNKVTTKTKSRDDKNKFSKTSKNDVDDLDFAHLRKPIFTSVTGFAQARKIFDSSTEELKGLLTTECDLLYECKVCRNIFRSLANLISHKRVYCKEKFNTSKHGHFIKCTSTVSELFKIKRLEEGFQEFLKSKDSEVRIEDTDDRVPLTKDLTAVVEQITKNRGIIENDKNENVRDVVLQKIPTSNVAMFQTVEPENEQMSDDMRTQVKELYTILSKDQAVLQDDGQYQMKSSVDINKKTCENDGVIQISDDDETDNKDSLKCKICNIQFATQKTLKFHMKYKHLESRLVYPCPDCIEIFSTSWSVYRHLFKVHRKTAAQIRRLRESIQSKAFKMNKPPAFYERKKNNLKVVSQQKITDEERFDQENLAWMDNMESDSELPRCGGCGRMFERRAALAAHTHTCQPRSRALARRPLENKKIEIQIRKDYNKGPTQSTAINFAGVPNLMPGHSIMNEVKQDQPDILDAQSTEQQSLLTDDNRESDLCTDDDLNIPPINDDEKLDPKKSQHVTSDEIKKMENKFSFTDNTLKLNFKALKEKMEPDVEIQNNLCKICNVHHSDIDELTEHMANHYKWNRYACKLCNYKNYATEKLPEHIQTVHKLKGNIEFYISTVKVLSPDEATEFNESIDKFTDDNNEDRFVHNESVESRRPSRCSSDSSRFSDNDSTSSSTRTETTNKRKRKMKQSPNDNKKKKSDSSSSSPFKDCITDSKESNEMSIDKVMHVIFGDAEIVKNKNAERYSSDMDDNDEKSMNKITKDDDNSNQHSFVTRRPIRKRTKPKNEDFEYDLSNLLKMEAQGYRDSQVTNNVRSNQVKKKIQIDIQCTDYPINRDCAGALLSISKKAVENSYAHMGRTTISAIFSQRTSATFARPTLPTSKTSNQEKSDEITVKNSTNELLKPKLEPISLSTDIELNNRVTSHNDIPLKLEDEDSVQHITISNEEILDTSNKKTDNDTNTTLDKNICEKVKANLNMSTVVPIKLRRQSLDVIKNPIVSQKITDFAKAGMKTKILVIKPINRNKEGVQTINNPFKFPTIKIKSSNKESHDTEEKISTDSAVLVKVPLGEDISNESNDALLCKETLDKTINNETVAFKQQNLDDSKQIEEKL